MQTNTGRRGYFANRASSNESLHIKKVDLRSDSIRAVPAETGVGVDQRVIGFRGHAGPSSQSKIASKHATELREACGSRTCKPNSVCRFRQDGHSSGPRITARLKRPTRRLWRTEPARVPGEAEALPGNPSLFGLAPCGVCPARRITAAAVRSYRTFSPLPWRCHQGGMFSVALSVEWFPTLAQKTRKNGAPPSRTLSGTLPCGVRTFLPSCDERPSGPAANDLIIVQAIARAGTGGNRCRTLGDLSSHSTSLGARKNVYNSRATPINKGISPAR